ncbi:nucleoside-diphosphate sugar epimerase/dehydratase [Paenibacillus sp. J2TS4]|uniref:polysaccharide biosynthesis protein n=1 Tax=Paenibacillus sp. J2TS4 TaxID=2807194 RepID=UPI001B0A09D2|nr:nucleoside-diphosphate sugar epimerase/dehydratase [Paenibacillus sp. J2TS4]GIP35033.1 UDP-N-acetylglucosamine 4,6-dehydratase [Paenibacillus sp. J2TS4]
MSYSKRLVLLMGIDSFIVLFAIYASHFIASSSFYPFSYALAISAATLFLCHHLFAYKYKLYHKVWKYASIMELISIMKAVTFSIAITMLVQALFTGQIFWRTMLITWLMHMFLIGGIRFSWRLYRDKCVNGLGNRKKTLIIGAGSAGTLVARQLMQNPDVDLCPVAFIDDDETKHRLEIVGLPVIGGREQIVQAVAKLNITNIIIAIPSLKKRELNAIVQQCNPTKAKVQIIPMFEDLMEGKVSVNEMRDVQVEDLLGRDPINLDTESIRKYITGSTVLVTGAGGSIGSEICRQLAVFSPRKLILLGHGENSIYSIEMELRSSFGQDIEFITEIADIQDRDRMFRVMRLHKPRVVFHAAAHKHVPLMERNPEESIKNNIIGTKNTAEAADRAGVETFVMISTDKAVNPTSVMGASKRIAEMIIQELDRRSHTRFVAVRFGNVLGSRGSVIPLFKEQIRKGGPVTVTHPDMVRYFMTIPEASRLVLQAGSLARGGEIFVLDMGQPVKIVDLATNLIKLSGYDVEDIGIRFSGIRPGEKLFEELLNENEVHEEQVYPKIYIGKATLTDEMADVAVILQNYEKWDRLVIQDRLLQLANQKKSKKLIVV